MAVVVLAVVAAVVGTVLWLGWQNDQRRVVGPDEVLGLGSAVTLWLVTVVVVAVVVLIGRLVALAVLRVDAAAAALAGRTRSATSSPERPSPPSWSAWPWPSSASG